MIVYSVAKIDGYVYPKYIIELAITDIKKNLTKKFSSSQFKEDSALVCRNFTQRK